MVEYNIEVQTGGIQIQYRSSQFNISWFQSRFQSYQFCYIDKLFRRKKIFLLLPNNGPKFLPEMRIA